MQNVSKGFVEQMSKQPYIAKVTLDGSETIRGEPIRDINFGGGANGDSEAVTIGCAVAGSVEITFDGAQVNSSFEQRKMEVELGQNVNGSIEWLPMGSYTVTDVTEDDGTIKVSGMDEIATKLDVEFEDIDGFDFESGEDISSLDLATAICNRHGIPIDLSGLIDYGLSGFLPYGCTDRQLLGMIAGLYGKYAMIDRTGIVRFRWYESSDVRITGDEYYEDGLEKAGYTFAVSWLKCYNEILEETMIRGDAEADQGIYFVCPWMTEDILDSIWNELQGFSYAPVAGLSFWGDPRIDPGDIITLVNLAGNSFQVPVMTISHEFDGGLKTSISAQGQTKTDAYEGPVQREVKRVTSKIVKTLEGIDMEVANAEEEISYLQLRADSIEARVEDAEGNIGDLQIRADEIEAKVEDAAGNIANLQIQADEIKGRVENSESEITEIKQTAGQVSVEASDENGTLVTRINPNEWIAEHKDSNGTVTSGFYYDFALGRFVYDGAGVFRSKDGNSYITLENGEFIVYARSGAEGDFIDIARIGFTEDSEGYDYPYFLMGHADPDGSNFDKIGLLKMFKNGIYHGNSAPRNSTGNFVGLNGAVGFFVDTLNGVAYTVDGETLTDVSVARFA